MRKILFRGKRIDNGEWVYGGCVFTENKVCLIYNQTHSIDLQGFTVEENSVGQYTGLTDLHNNPIFEGDIVKGVCYAGKTEGIVTFKNGYYYIHAYAGYCEQLSRCSHMIEVIGNIHDNHELPEANNEANMD